MKKAVIISVLSALILASCNEVPEDVKSRTEEQQARESAAADDSKAYADSNFDPYKKVPLSEVKAELEGYQFKKHDNLNFICKLSPITADELYNINVLLDYGFTADENDKAKFKGLLVNFWHLEPDKLELNNEGPMVACVYPYGDDEIEIAQYAHKTGSFMLYDPATVNFSIKNHIVYTAYSPENSPAEKLKMADGSELSVSETQKQAEEYIRQLKDYEFFDEGEAQKLYKVGIGTAEGHGDVILLRYQQTRYGLPIDESGTVGKWPTRSPHFDIYFAGNNKLMMISNWQSQKGIGKEPVSEIIPLSSAEYLASDGLAPNMKFDVSEVELRYLCLTWDKYRHDVETEPNHEFTLHPYWCFTLKEEAEIKAPQNELQRMQIFIDAETGELFYSDPSKYELLTKEDLLSKV